MESLRKKVETALDAIRPYLQSDGGDVKLVRLNEDFSVEVELSGSCESCSMSNMTLKAGIEEAIRKVAPEVIRVTAI